MVWVSACQTERHYALFRRRSKGIRVNLVNSTIKKLWSAYLIISEPYYLVNRLRHHFNGVTEKAQYQNIGYGSVFWRWVYQRFGHQCLRFRKVAWWMWQNEPGAIMDTTCHVFAWQLGSFYVKHARELVRALGSNVARKKTNVSLIEKPNDEFPLPELYWL